MKYLTIVYNIPDDFDTRELLDHEYLSAASWSHALDERDHWKAICREKGSLPGLEMTTSTKGEK